ncbi:MAG: hypothetical protein GF355_02890 [Candidatus Eisenbacteria bacterium]|nr:hypothetical protein [Candidatus Eisenbacteria bacterium]
MEFAQTEAPLAALPEEFDADPWAFNVLNGTLDLHTGELRPHDRDDKITQLAPIQHDPEARLQLWENFLESAAPDTELRAFLRRAVGYSLTGCTDEERLLFVHGQQATGKSTFLEAVKATFGDYGKRANFESLLAQRNGGGPRNDIARLHGSRLVVSLEMDDGRRLAEGLVKQLTGGDTVAARFLYQEAFEFKPQFKLWLAANSKPRIRDDDGATWRRILRVPFEEEIPEGERDPKVKATLSNPATAGPAILAWALRGCMEWQERRLDPPEAVRLATADYRAEMHPLRGWLEDCCEIDGDAWTSSADAWASYHRYAPRGLSQQKFTSRLKEERFIPERRDRNTRRGWRGLRVVDTSGHL